MPVNEPELIMHNGVDKVYPVGLIMHLEVRSKIFRGENVDVQEDV